MEEFREKIRQQLATKYKQDLREGRTTATEITATIKQLESALIKAKKTKHRVPVEGQPQMGNMNDIEIEDQIAAFRRVL